MRSDKKMFQIAFEANWAQFASPNKNITQWTFETKSIDNFVDEVFRSFVQMKAEERRQNTTSELAKIARRAARFGINPQALDQDESS